MEKDLFLKNGQKPARIAESRRGPAVERPDVGWAWVVAGAACAINLIMAGLNRMSGILYVAFLEAYSVDRRAASVPFSVRSSTGNLLGPIVGILGQKYGVRPIVLIGGVIASASASACFLADDITTITILWGVINGIGTAFIILLPQVVIGQYFKKYRTTASGIAFSGGCFGSFMFPSIMEMLLHKYGVEGTFLIMGTIIMHTIPAGMILRKPIWLKGKKKLKDIESPCHTPKSAEVNFADRRSLFVSPMSKSPIKSPGFYPDIRLLRQNNDLVLKLLTSIMATDEKDELNQSKKTAMRDCIRDELKELYSSLEHTKGKSQFYQNLRLARKNLFPDETKKEAKLDLNSNDYNGRFLSLKSGGLIKTASEPNIAKITNEISRNMIQLRLKEILEYEPSHLSLCFPEHHPRKVLKSITELTKLHNYMQYRDSGLPEYDAPPSYSSVVQKPCVSPLQRSCVESAALKAAPAAAANSFWDHIKTALRLYKKLPFLMICLGRVVHFVGFIPVLTIVVDFVMDKGLQEEDGKYAIAAISFGDLVGRLGFGWVTDRGYMTLPKYMLVVMILQGASTASLPMMHNRVTIFAALAVFSMFEGSLFVRHPVLVSKYLENHEQSIAMGCMNFFAGLLGFAMPVYIGFFRDSMQSYDCIFYINGAFGILAGLLWFLEPYFVKSLRPRRNSDSSTPV